MSCKKGKRGHYRHIGFRTADGLRADASIGLLARFSGDKVGDENEIPVSAILLPDFSGMTEAEKANAPRCQSLHKGHRYECRIGKEIKGTSGYYHNQYRTFSFTNQ